jgi:hypothetical protein
VYVFGGERGETCECLPCGCQAELESNVLSLSGAPLTENLANPQIISLLEEILDSAKKGEVSSLSMTILSPGGWSRIFNISKENQGLTLLGAMVLAQRDFASAWKHDV